ncbi:phytoene dehydrogenase-like protein [Gorgonomyces haynaldii]|nr:phytoene dehydrogenase-like protein [Gorgonomyces haynaldii]
MPKVIVIGSGVGGVTTAGLLAKEGHQVTVYEKNSFSGGRLSIIERDGFRFDQGPSLLLMPDVFERAFNDLGERMSDHLDLVKCDPNYEIHFANGQKITLSTDMDQMKQELERIEPSSWSGFRKFFEEAGLHYKGSVDKILNTSFIKFTDFINLDNLPLLVNLHVLDKLYRRVSECFKSDELRQAFTFQTMYMGMSPYDAPATYSLLSYTEIQDGIWYPKGGFHQVIQKLMDISKQKYGCEYVFDKGVQEIVIDPKTNQAKGVRFSDGTFEECDIVVSNVDTVTCYSKMLPRDYVTTWFENLEQTSSTFSFYWGLKAPIENLEAHNIFLAGDFKASFSDIFQLKSLPQDPSFYVHVPSKVDPSACPDGKSTITVLVPVGYMNGTQDWQALQTRAKESIIQIMNARLGIDLEQLIETEVINTPMDWESKFGLWKGSALGLDHSILQVAWFRPGHQHHKHKNVFFVGASTHPGTGVPIVLCGARLVAGRVKRFLNGTAESNWWVYLLVAFVLLVLSTQIPYK